MPPNFLLTKYFYPLSAPISLSGSLRFAFDNPRTEQEIEYTRRFITDLYDSAIVSVLPPRSKEDVITLESIAETFQSAYAKEDPYVAGFFKGYRRRNLFDCFAKMWCVVRFDDEGQMQEIENARSEMHERGVKGFVMLDDDSPIVRNSEALINYCNLLALVSHTEGKEYYGRDFIWDPEQLSERRLLEGFTMHVTMLAVANRDHETRPEHIDELSWIFNWRFGSNLLFKSASLLDGAFESGHAEELLYVGSLLGIANRTHDERIRLLILTSIIELLVTRNPDTARFNVEDSISKQFQLKAGALILLNDPERDSEALKKSLKAIYRQRSNVAHGNFKDLARFGPRMSDEENGEEYLGDHIADLYSYIRAILEEYLRDTRLVKFIKAG